MSESREIIKLEMRALATDIQQLQSRISSASTPASRAELQALLVEHDQALESKAMLLHEPGKTSNPT